MTDRFYPIGKPSDVDAWKSSYEAQNEMRAFHRSAYPPGYAGHEPGAREKYGFGSPGPIQSRLAHPELAHVEDTGILEPRRSQALPRHQVADDRETFACFDLTDVHASRTGKATLNLSPSMTSPASRSRSTPAIGQRSIRSRMCEPLRPIGNHEDEHHSYFVPKGLQRERKEKLMSMSLSKLPKTQKVTLSWDGDGTGFKTSIPPNDWWPNLQMPGLTGGDDHLVPPTSASAFRKPVFHRHAAFHPARSSSLGATR